MYANTGVTDLDLDARHRRRRDPLRRPGDKRHELERAIAIPSSPRRTTPVMQKTNRDAAFPGQSRYVHPGLQALGDDARLHLRRPTAAAVRPGDNLHPPMHPVIMPVLMPVMITITTGSISAVATELHPAPPNQRGIIAGQTIPGYVGRSHQLQRNRAFRVIERYIGAHPFTTIVITRFIGVSTTAANLVCGLVAMPIRTFLLADGIANALCAGLYLGLGYTVGRLWRHAGLLQLTGIVALISVALYGLIMGAIYLFRDRFADKTADA